jgi:hypothetical protein
MAMKKFAILAMAVVAFNALASGCGPADFSGQYSMTGSRTSSAECMGSPPSGALQVADTTISQADANGVITMRMRIGTGNDCILTLQESGGTATITGENNCDATIAPPFFTSPVGTLSRANDLPRLAVRWSMAGAGTGPCTVNDVWAPMSR